MKRVLYGTTALATAGLILGAAGSADAAERLQLKVNGYHQQWLVVNSGTSLESGAGDHPFDANDIDQKHNSEVCFNGEIRLDNGITVGVDVQLEANTETDQIDESYMYVATENLGKLILGDENNAAYLMQVVAPDGGVSVNEGDLNSVTNQGLIILPGDFDVADTTVTSTRFRFDDNDSGKFTYISPRFAGFQIGLSYIPNYENGGGDNNNSIKSINGAKGVAGTGNTTAGISDGFAGALNFKEQFGDFGVQASLGYQYGDVGSNVGDDNLHAYGAGLQLSFAGFTVGGSFTRAQGDKAGGQEYDGYGWDAGVAYAFGPYTVGLTYLRGQTEGLAADSSKQYAEYLVLSGGYALGPGVRLVGGIYGFDLDGEDGATGATAVQKSDGIGGAMGFKLSF